MAETKPPIRFSGISHCYGRTDALRNIDLDITPGSTVGVIGPDGVGKSTLLALLSATAGRAPLAGLRELRVDPEPTAAQRVFGRERRPDRDTENIRPHISRWRAA